MSSLSFQTQMEHDGVCFWKWLPKPLVSSSWSSTGFNRSQLILWIVYSCWYALLLVTCKMLDAIAFVKLPFLWKIIKLQPFVFSLFRNSERTFSSPSATNSFLKCITMPRNCWYIFFLMFFLYFFMFKITKDLMRAEIYKFYAWNLDEFLNAIRSGEMFRRDTYFLQIISYMDILHYKWCDINRKLLKRHLRKNFFFRIKHFFMYYSLLLELVRKA